VSVAWLNNKHVQAETDEDTMNFWPPSLPPSLALLAFRRPSVFGLTVRASVRGHILSK